jgi:hypothetical protein
MNSVVVMLLSVLLGGLTLESSAAAESAWVLWAEQKRSTRGGPTSGRHSIR